MKETIKAIKPEEMIAMNFHMEGMMDMEYEMHIKENNGKTTITSKSTTAGVGLFSKIMVSFMKGMMKTQEDKNLNSLKKLVDENTTDYFPELEMVQEMEPATNE